MSREDLLFLIKKKKKQLFWEPGLVAIVYMSKLVSKAQRLNAHQKSTVYWIADDSTISP